MSEFPGAWKIPRAMCVEHNIVRTRPGSLWMATFGPRRKNFEAVRKCVPVKLAAARNAPPLVVRYDRPSSRATRRDPSLISARTLPPGSPRLHQIKVLLNEG